MEESRTLDSIFAAARHSHPALSTKCCSGLQSENALRQYRSVKHGGFLAMLRNDSFYFRNQSGAPGSRRSLTLTWETACTTSQPLYRWRSGSRLAKLLFRFSRYRRSTTSQVNVQKTNVNLGHPASLVRVGCAKIGNKGSATARQRSA